MVRLVGIDGKDYGVIYRTKPDSMGAQIALTIKHEWLEKYYVRDADIGRNLLKRLLERAEVLGKDNHQVLVALVRRTFDQVTIPPGSILNLNVDEPDAYIVSVDSKGNPVPLEALVTNSPHLRQEFAKLKNFYTAAITAYNKLVYERDLYRQLVHAQQILLETRDYEVHTLIEANTRMQEVFRNLQSTVHTLSAQLTMMEQLLAMSSMEADKWRETSQKVINEIVPSITRLVTALAQEISRGLTYTMQQHAAELSRAEAIEATVASLLNKIKEIQTKNMAEVQKVLREIKTPPVGGEEVAGEEGARGEEGSQSE